MREGRGRGGRWGRGGREERYDDMHRGKMRDEGGGGGGRG